MRAFSEASLTRDLFSIGACGIQPAALCDAFFDRFQRRTMEDPAAGRYRAYVLSTELSRR